MRAGGIFSPLGDIEVSDEDKKAAASEYENLARQCYENKLDSACKKKAALVGLVGPSLASLIDGCAQGTSSDCAKAQAIQGTTSACTAYAGPEAAPVCAWVSSRVIGKAWPYVEDAAGFSYKLASGAIVFTLEAFGLKSAPKFEPVADKAWSIARSNWDSAKDGFIQSVASGIRDVRLDLGVPGDLVQYGSGFRPISEVASRILYEETRAVCEGSQARVQGSGFDLFVPHCAYSQASGTISTSPLGREDRFNAALVGIKSVYQSDMLMLSEAMKRAIPRILATEASNPDTVAASAKAAKRAELSASIAFAKSIGIEADTRSVVSKLGLKRVDNSVQEAPDGRMRLFLAAIGVSAAIGIGLALGRKRK